MTRDEKQFRYLHPRFLATDFQSGHVRPSSGSDSLHSSWERFESEADSCQQAACLPGRHPAEAHRARWIDQIQRLLLRRSYWNRRGLVPAHSGHAWTCIVGFGNRRARTCHSPNYRRSRGLRGQTCGFFEQSSRPPGLQTTCRW